MMDASWSDGYVADSEYMPGFYKDQVPANLDLACLLNGIAPPVRAAGWTYCDLGCGQGATLLVLAAANPDGRFIGVDFNPAHIARAREVAARAGIGNAEFLEASFEELADDPSALPPLDYVAAHGVYSWIGERSRQALVRLLGARLKPGGLAYVSYNAQPGWNRIAPVQRLIFEHAAASGRPSGQAVVEAVAFLRATQAEGAPSLAMPEVLERLEQEIARGNTTYLAHEYLNANWQPRYHADVARELAAAKLSFAGSATLLENFPDVCLRPGQRALVDGAAGALRETLRDNFMARTFRRDVFVRGARRMTHEEREARAGAVSLALLRAPRHLLREIEVPIGKVELSEAPYAALLARLADGPARIADLLAGDGPRGDGRPATSAVEVVGMLVGSGQAAPHAPAVDAAPARAFNAVSIRDLPFASAGVTPVAAPAIGGGVHFRLFDRLVLAALLDGTAPEPEAVAGHAWAALRARGVRLTEAGREVPGDAENLAILRRETGEVLADGLAVWRRLGLL